MSNIAHYIQDQADIIENHLDRLVPNIGGHNEKLYEAARYALLGGGKRLRPILALTTAKMLGVNIDHALSPACALEIIHTYSLIHDDLPSMDDDDIRRGKPSVHRQYPEGHAILTGDYLLTYAFEILATDSQLNSTVRTELISTLARRSGSEGMIGGQVMDLAYGGSKIPLETLRLLHRNKTAALITASIEFGAIIANVPHHELDHLRCFGENIGLAFQVIDDILDVTSSEAKHGHAIGSDIKNEKTTYVTLLGVDQAKIFAQNLYDQAVDSLKMLPYDTSLLAGLAHFIVHREY